VKKIDQIKKFLEVEELSKLEQGLIQGGIAEEKQKIKIKCDCKNCSCKKLEQSTS
jgi:hypothetical protein